jgi:membrane-bound inhibitor of C-type lysozyme
MRRSGALLPPLGPFLLALAGCHAGGPPVAPPLALAGAPKPDHGSGVYHCADGRTVRAEYPGTRTAVVELDGHTYTLKAQLSADGVRYAGDGLQWWTKGLDQGRLSRLGAGEEVASDPGVLCQAPSASPP